MLEKEVIVRAKDESGFGSFAETSILRVKDEDLENVREVLKDADIAAIPYPNAGLAYAEDVAEKLLTTMVNRRIEEQEINGIPVSESDRVLADEAVYNVRANVGLKIYDGLLNREKSFAESMVDDIAEHAHKKISVDQCVQLGLLTPSSLIEKLDKDSTNSCEVEYLLEEELDKHNDMGGYPVRNFTVTTDEQKGRGYASKKEVLY